MVYCGRPSASCAPCRSRKKRCDKAVPACGQCRRMGRECSGYRDVSELVFRDETTRVIDRARTKRAKTSHTAQSVASSPAATVSSVSDSTASTVSMPDMSADSPADIVDMADTPPALPALPALPDLPGQPGQSDNTLQPHQLLPDTTPTTPATPTTLTSLTSLATLPDADAVLLDDPLWDAGSLVLASPTLSNLPKSLAAPAACLQDMAVSFFLSNYVLTGSGPCPGVFHYAAAMLADDDDGNDSSLTRVAISAAGLAGLANATGAEDVLRQARQTYAGAIERVNDALADHDTARADSTMMAVLVLGLFESIMCADDEALAAWRHHVDGAAHLLVHRGTAQFRSLRGIQLFGEALSHILTLCTRYGRPLPACLRTLRAEMARRVPSHRDTPAARLSTVHIAVLDLWHRVDPDSDTPCLAADWEALLSRATALDRTLETAFAAPIDGWRFTTVHDPGAQPRVVYHGTYHIYYNVWVAKVWDGIRACRLILNQILLSLLQREAGTWAPHELVAGTGTGGTYADMVPRVLDTIVRMRDDILASVPQMLGFVHHDPQTGASYLDCCGTTADMPPLTPATGAYFVLWYLFLAGTLPTNEPATRAWVVDRLRAIRTATGIQKAGYLADTLEQEAADATLHAAVQQWEGGLGGLSSMSAMFG